MKEWHFGISLNFGPMEKVDVTLVPIHT